MQIPQNGEVEEVYNTPRVNVETIRNEPRIITERIVGEPVYMKNQLIEPIRQRIEI